MRTPLLPAGLHSCIHAYRCLVLHPQPTNLPWLSCVPNRKPTDGCNLVLMR
jgi:hypothetical protein